MAKWRVLIIGHSFIDRLKAFVQQERHIHTYTTLNGIGQVHFHGVGGRTIAKFRKFDFDIVRRIAPHIIVLELGSNDLVELSPQTVGSELETLPRELHELPSVQLVVIGQVLRRRSQNSDNFNCKVTKLHKYPSVVLEQLPFDITGDIGVFGTPTVSYIYPTEFTLID